MSSGAEKLHKHLKTSEALFLLFAFLAITGFCLCFVPLGNPVSIGEWTYYSLGLILSGLSICAMYCFLYRVLKLRKLLFGEGA